VLDPTGPVTRPPPALSHRVLAYGVRGQRARMQTPGASKRHSGRVGRLQAQILLQTSIGHAAAEVTLPFLVAVVTVFAIFAAPPSRIFPKRRPMSSIWAA
jgi:hypothetical protein